MKKIIVCADNSALSKNVCEFGINLAKNFGFGLVFLSADKAISCLAKVFDRIENIYDYICDDIKNNLLCAAKNSSKSQKCLENMQEFALKNGIESEILLKQGEILSVLTKIKDEQDIFVLGNSLNSGRSENLLNIIKELKTPIFVVSENFSNDKSAEFNKNSSICVCFDGSAQSKEILSIVSKNFPNNKKFILNLSTLKKPSEEIFSKISHLKNDKNSEFIALYGKNDEILKFIKRENIGLVACGAFGSSGIKRLFFGSFSKFLLKNAKIPILIIS